MHSEPPTSWAGTLAGMIILLVLPTFVVLGKILAPLLDGPNGPQEPAVTIASLFGLFMLFGIPVTGLGIGWVKGFPRWSFPYAAIAFLNTVYISFASTPGLSVAGYEMFGDQMWGGRAYFPLLIMLVIVLFVARKDIFRPFDSLISLLGRDITPMTFAFFGMLPLLSFISFDEIEDSFEMPFQAFNMAVMFATVLLYLRSTRSWQRAAALFAGSLIVVNICTVAPILYWLESNGVNITQSIVNGTFLLFIINLPTLLGFLRKTPSTTPGVQGT